MELNQEAPVTDRAPIGGDTGQRERPTVRESLQRSFADARREGETQEREARSTEDEEVVEEVAEPVEGQEAEVTEPAEGESTEVEAGTETEPKEKPESKVAAPTAWPKEAKSSWAVLPDSVKKAVLKREADVEKGVKSLKDKYSDIDKALEPYTQVISQFQKTPAQAVSQLFSWFDALAKNPDEAFPALIQSYKYNPEKMLAKYGYYRAKPGQQPNGQAQQAQNGQAQPGQQQPAGDISPALQAYINDLEQKRDQKFAGYQQQVGQQFNGFQQYVAEQNAAKTQEMLERWAADKPHFSEVRTLMGHLLSPDPATGVAAIQLRDGKVDLDAAYEAAIYANPEVRAKVLADQQASADAARKAKAVEVAKAQAEKTEKARRASGSLVTSSPGSEVGRRGSTPSKPTSVRDSLKAAISELSDR